LYLFGLIFIPFSYNRLTSSLAKENTNKNVSQILVFCRHFLKSHIAYLFNLYGLAKLNQQRDVFIYLQPVATVTP
jgi:hypothetical protein